MASCSRPAGPRPYICNRRPIINILPIPVCRVMSLRGWTTMARTYAYFYMSFQVPACRLHASCLGPPHYRRFDRPSWVMTHRKVSCSAYCRRCASSSSLSAQLRPHPDGRPQRCTYCMLAYRVACRRELCACEPRPERNKERRLHPPPPPPVDPPPCTPHPLTVLTAAAATADPLRNADARTTRPTSPKDVLAPRLPASSPALKHPLGAPACLPCAPSSIESQSPPRR